MSNFQKVLIAFVIGFAVAVLCGLGLWQLMRLDWKNNTVTERNQRISGSVIEITNSTGLTSQDLDWQRVRVSGSWLPPVLIVGNRARSGIRGTEYIKPLKLAENLVVLVNLGWSRETNINSVLDEIKTEYVGHDTLSGLATDRSEVRGKLTSSGIWTTFSPQDMKENLSITNVALWTITKGELTENQFSGVRSESYLIDGYQPFINTTPHLEYALTWFGIAIVLVITAGIRLDWWSFVKRLK
ncbi:MAG: SURF1 family protein [Chloroflexota bacterium]|nr:SURF1 family protein [Chloroflexota bacterium]